MKGDGALWNRASRAWQLASNECNSLGHYRANALPLPPAALLNMAPTLPTAERSLASKSRSRATNSATTANTATSCAATTDCFTYPAARFPGILS